MDRHDGQVGARIRESAAAEAPRMFRFLRELVAIPSEGGREEAVVRRIAAEMEDVGFHRVEIDPMGNVLGTIGTGGRLIALDGHVDTVGVGSRELWSMDPLEGCEDEERICGRGSSDQKGGVAAMVYAGKIIRELSLQGDCTILMVGSIQEEDCEGLCWEYIIKEGGIRPDFVLSTEPSSCTVCRGQRGRMEIRVSTSGRSCHGSAPERGENAIFKMAPILQELEEISGRLGTHPFLGRGTLTVSEVFFTSPSRCAVADSCSISIDRRLTLGETAEDAVEQIRGLASVREAGAIVEVYDYERPSYTGLLYPTQAYFPAWLLEPDHPAVCVLTDAYRVLFAKEPVVDKWTFSTNGVSITGRFGIPTVGFGPGHEDQAHAPDECTWKEELVTACALYAAVPTSYEAWRRREGRLIGEDA